jgi:hypothetical protein
MPSYLPFTSGCDRQLSLQQQALALPASISLRLLLRHQPPNLLNSRSHHQQPSPHKLLLHSMRTWYLQSLIKLFHYSSSLCVMCSNSCKLPSPRHNKTQPKLKLLRKP